MRAGWCRRYFDTGFVGHPLSLDCPVFSVAFGRASHRQCRVESTDVRGSPTSLLSRMPSGFARSVSCEARRNGSNRPFAVLVPPLYVLAATRRGGMAERLKPAVLKRVQTSRLTTDIARMR